MSLCWPSNRLTDEIAERLKEAGVVERYESNGMFMTVQLKPGAKVMFREFSRLVKEICPDVDEVKIVELWKTLFAVLSEKKHPTRYVIASKPAYTKTIAFRVDEDTYRKLAELAREDGMAISDLMRRIVSEYLGEG